MKTTHQVIHGDCLVELNGIPDNSVDMVLTSPPYDSLRDGHDNGLDLAKVGEHIYRILNDGGVAAIIIQDQTKNFQKSMTTFKMAVDWNKTGLKLFECVIWSKDGRPGAWWSKRFRVDHEYILIFFKGDKPQYFDKSHLAEEVRPYQNKGTTRLSSGETVKNTSGSTLSTKSRGTIWNYTPSKSERGPHRGIKLQHPSTFPDKLAEDLIRTFCQPDGLVVDPFSGSGTTSVAAAATERNSIAIEINEDFVEIINKRMAIVIER